ncbi:uncharacterized protein LOC119655286 [Hermetia illucens]|uniref:uncharacterized protein LOC119655286 n=1 Tax=Hermetia illucens TaxID=343691 RepID=UPI0018CC3259|nr:uncharacterized protein LOC119655286 [Hermetia illucens]
MFPCADEKLLSIRFKKSDLNRIGNLWKVLNQLFVFRYFLKRRNRCLFHRKNGRRRRLMSVCKLGALQMQARVKGKWPCYYILIEKMPASLKFIVYVVLINRLISRSSKPAVTCTA